MTHKPDNESSLEPTDADAREKEAQAIRGLAAAYARLRQENRQSHYWPKRRDRSDPDCDVQPGPLSAGRCSGIGQDTAGQHRVRNSATVLSSHPVYTRL